MTDVAPETVEELVRTVRYGISIEYIRVSRRDTALAALDRLHSLLLRAEEERDEYEKALREIAFPELRGPNPDAGIVIARHALTPVGTKERPEGREGMVTVYDDQDCYLGCIAEETKEAGA